MNEIPINLKNAIMMDGWAMATAAKQIIGQKYENKRLEMCLGNLLIGIVLWEDAFFPLDDQYKDSFEYIQDKIGKNHPLFERCKPHFGILKQERAFPISASDEEEIMINYDFEKKQIFIDRTKEYEKLREDLRVNYFPHPGRAEYMLEQQEKFNKIFDRNTIINNEIDKPLREYYYEIEQKYNHRLLNCSYPILYNYIKNEARKIGTSPMHEVDYSLKLRNRPDVVAFRKILKQMEENFKKMNLSAVDRVVNEIREISKSIMGISPKEIKEEPLPVILTETGAKEKPLNLTFVTKLLDYGKQRSHNY